MYFYIIVMVSTIIQMVLSNIYICIFVYYFYFIYIIIIQIVLNIYFIFIHINILFTNKCHYQSIGNLFSW